MQRYLKLVTASAALALSALPVAAQTMECDDNGGPEICVQFDNFGNAPEEGVDFDFDLSDPDYPGVKLRKGDDGEDLYEWRVWSWNKSTHVPANMGSIYNDTNDKNWDYHITILQPDDDPGADDLKHVDLGEAEIGSTHWSKVESGEITGDLPANATFKLHRYDSSGGYANFTIGDDVGSGTVIELGRGEGFTVEGSVGGVASYVTINIEDGIQGGNFTIEESTMNVIANVGGVITNGAFQVGDTPSTQVLTVNEMGAGGAINYGVQLTTYEEIAQTSYIQIKSDLPSTASINAPDLHLFGAIRFEDDAIPPNRKDIHGTITLETFGGLISADDLTGTIDIARSFFENTSGPELSLAGSMSGTLNVNSSEGNYWLDDVEIEIGGDLTSDGEIRIYRGSNGDFDAESKLDITGDLAGTIFIGGDFAGIVEIDDDFSSGADFTVGTQATPTDMVDGASFTVAGNSRGDFWVTGNVEDEAALTLNKLGANGDILVDGDFHGDISITKDTNATSLIQLGKLMSAASIVINAGEDDVSDADGQIFIGNPAAFCSGGGQCFLDDVEYDGVINILNGTSGGGDFTGVITVQGCHDDEVAMELCICGTDSGTKNIEQTDCENEVPGFACSSSPCN